MVKDCEYIAFKLSKGADVNMVKKYIENNFESISKNSFFGIDNTSFMNNEDVCAFSLIQREKLTNNKWNFGRKMKMLDVE